eukprot:773063-Rhodomonas_salina.1
MQATTRTCVSSLLSPDRQVTARLGERRWHVTSSLSPTPPIPPPILIPLDSELASDDPVTRPAARAFKFSLKLRVPVAGGGVLAGLPAPESA